MVVFGVVIWNLLECVSIEALRVQVPCQRSARHRPCSPLDAASSSLDWDDVGRQFALDPRHVHMGALPIALHPRPAADAIEAYRRALDRHAVLEM
jgi:hypothetical protein